MTRQGEQESPCPVGWCDSRWASKSPLRRPSGKGNNPHHQAFLPQKLEKGLVAMTALSRETEPKLLSMLPQVALDSRELVRVGRTKSPVLIDVDQACVLKT